jgi:hypothetical protein
VLILVNPRVLIDIAIMLLRMGRGIAAGLLPPCLLLVVQRSAPMVLLGEDLVP